MTRNKTLTAILCLESGQLALEKSPMPEDGWGEKEFSGDLQKMADAVNGVIAKRTEQGHSVVGGDKREEEIKQRWPGCETELGRFKHTLWMLGTIASKLDALVQATDAATAQRIMESARGKEGPVMISVEKAIKAAAAGAGQRNRKESASVDPAILNNQ